jgi:hypothetical protein
MKAEEFASSATLKIKNPQSTIVIHQSMSALPPESRTVGREP